MSGTKYLVEIEFASKGNFEDKVSRVSTHLKSADGAALKLGESLRNLGGKFMAPIDAAATKIADVATTLAKLGVGAGLGAAAYGVAKLNKELEKTEISLAAMMAANDRAVTIGHGMKLASSLLASMRKDAAELPGEFADLAGIMRTVMLPGFHAGKSVEELERFSAKVMAAGAVTGLPFDQVARETAMLLEGRSGAHNVLGMRMMGLGGAKAEEFNKSSPEERFNKVEETITKFAPAIEEYKKSFEGLSSTFLDNAKQFLGLATMPLFDKIKSTLADGNKWFDEHKSETQAWAEVIGGELAAAFDWGKAKILEWGPLIFEFADSAHAKLVSIWHAIEPLVDKISTKAKEFFQDPEAFEKLEHIAKVYMGLKLGQTAAGGMFDMAQVAAPLMLMVKGAGGTSAAGLSGALGASVEGLAAIAAPAAVAIVAVAGAVHVLNDESSLLHESAVDTWSKMGESWSNTWSSLKVAGEGAFNAITPLINALGYTLIEAAGAATGVIQLLAWTLENTIGKFTMPRGTQDHDITEAEYRKAQPLRSVRTYEEKARAQAFFDMVTKSDLGAVKGNPVLDALQGMAKWQQPQPRHPGGAGTNIQKVEIVVTSNSDPSRIARLVMGEIQNLKRHPRASSDVPNWSGPRPHPLG